MANQSWRCIGINYTFNIVQPNVALVATDSNTKIGKNIIILPWGQQMPMPYTMYSKEPESLKLKVGLR